MFCDTTYRHNQALSPAGFETIPAALHALNAAVDDCRRAGKPIARDAAIILLIRTLADAAERSAPSASELRLRCVADRAAVLASPARINSALGADHEDGTTELRHADIGIRVVPRGFLPDSEISFNRCRNGEPAGKVHLAPIAELLDTAAFARRLASTVGTVGAPPLAVAA